MESLFNKKKGKDVPKLVFTLFEEILKEKGISQTIAMDTQLNALGLASIDYMNFMLKLEENLGLELEEIVGKFNICSMLTIKDVVDMLT